MFTESLGMSNNFSVTVETTNNRGFTPEETAKRCVDKIIGISDNSHLQYVIKLMLIAKKWKRLLRCI